MAAETIGALLKTMQHRMERLYSPQEARTAALRLCMHFLGRTMGQILIATDEYADEHVACAMLHAAGKIAHGTPLQYIEGSVDFYGCTIKVDSSVLIPRPQTEELTEWIAQYYAKRHAASILDIGCGSGCIAIALAKTMPEATVDGWEVSLRAACVARSNAAINGVLVKVCHADIFAPPPCSKQWEVIVSNPPYIPRSQRASLPKNILSEPSAALFVPNAQPLLYYERIADFAAEHLCAHGRLFFEINEDYGNEMTQMLCAKGFDSILKKDLNGADRMMMAWRREK
jgi:release factor glutamine methyltransferase